jgi:group I intron endonuclease
MSDSRTGEKNHMFGKEHTEETKQKMSEAQSGEKSHNYGKTLSDEHKQKMSEALSGEKNPMYGNNHTEETKRKISEAKSGEKNTTSKRVYQYTIDGIYVNAYGSGGEAARALGKSSGSKINECARGKRPTMYGFKWSRELL